MKNYELILPMGHVWFGDLPNQWRYATEHFEENIAENVAALPTVERSVCLKFFLPSFHGSSGILGAHFLPDDSKQFVIRVGVTNRVEQNRIVINGLNDEYAAVVLRETIAWVQETNYLGAGILQFEYGAYDRIDSNIFVFRLLTRSILDLLNPSLDIDHLSVQDVTIIVQKALASILSN